MQDRNNLQIADLILQWIDERVSRRGSGNKWQAVRAELNPAEYYGCDCSVSSLR